MPIWDLEGFERAFAGSGLWRLAIARSLSAANMADLSQAVILDCGGGSGWLAAAVSDSAAYVLLDKNFDKLETSPVANKVCGSAECLPFGSGAFDVVVSISTLQYLNHDIFFAECTRVLKPGGLLMLHENGPSNPFILPIRFLRFLTAGIHPTTQAYVETITEYLRPGSLDLQGFTPTLRAPSYLLSALCWILEYCSLTKASRAMAPLLMYIDRKLLMFAPLRQLAFLNVLHFRKSACSSVAERAAGVDNSVVGHAPAAAPSA